MYTVQCAAVLPEIEQKPLKSKKCFTNCFSLISRRKYKPKIGQYFMHITGIHCITLLFLLQVLMIL